MQCLKSLVLKKYEALACIALLKVVSATASEIHEISTVPRASVYPVLDQLQKKKHISVARSTPKRFAALSPEGVVAIMMSRIEHDAPDAREILSTIHRERISHEQSSEDLIWNVYGIENIQRKLTDIITAASHTIRIIAHPQFIHRKLKKCCRIRQNIQILRLSPTSGRIAIREKCGSMSRSIRKCRRNLTE
ncbi:MAG: TrmB family transcriptional regulator [Methanoregula sp.]